jgi:outer membrane protein TolC
MMNKLLIALICGGAPLAAPLFAEDSPAPAPSLSLAQVIDQVLSRHPSLDAAQAAVDAARARTEQGNAGRLPQVSVSGSYTFMTPRPYVSFSLPSGSSQFYETSQNSYTTALGLRQLLTDFGHTDAVVALARAGEISARDALDQVRSQLGYQAIQAFYGVLLLRESIGVADEEIRALEESGRISAQKFSSGSVTKLDVLTTGVRLANARNRRTDTVAALQKQEALLRELLSDAPGASLPLAGEFEDGGQSPDLSSVIAEALQNRPEMKLAHDDEATSERRIDAADRVDRPVVAAQASGGVEDGTLPDLYDNRGYVAANVGVSVPLFTGHRSEGLQVEARADLRAAQARERELAATITTDVEDALTDLAAARSRLRNADALVSQANEALSLARSRYANGVITDFELLDAQSSARGAELTRLQARYDCTLARQALARATGRPPAP